MKNSRQEKIIELINKFDIETQEELCTKLSEEELMMEALEAGADNFEADDDFYEITTAPDDFSKVREYLEGKGIKTKVTC